MHYTIGFLKSYHNPAAFFYGFVDRQRVASFPVTGRAELMDTARRLQPWQWLWCDKKHRRDDDEARRHHDMIDRRL